MNSKPLQERLRWRKLSSLFTIIVRIQKTSVGSSAGWDWVPRPLGSCWECAFSRSQGWDSSPVGLFRSKLDQVVVVGKLKRSFLETLLSQTRSPLRSQLTKPVRVTTSVVRRDAPPNFNRLASRPGGGQDVPEREVLRPGAVAVTSSRAAASSTRCRVCWTTLRVPTSNSTSGMHRRSSRGPSRQQRADNLVFIYLSGSDFSSRL